MKLSLEFAEVVQMLSRELGRDVKESNITITQEPFGIEISGLNFEELMRIREIRAQPDTRPYPEPQAEKPMVEMPEKHEDTAAEIAGILNTNQQLAQNAGGAGPVPQDADRHNIPNIVTETPADFLPPGATYDPPGEMDMNEIKGRGR